MTTTPLCFIDVETTGLDSRIHQPYEVCYWHEDAEEPRTIRLPHTLEHADGGALRIGGYFDRHMSPYADPSGAVAADLVRVLRGVTLVGSNPSFDAGMLRTVIGTEVWHHRLIDVSQAAMWVLGLDRPPGLAKAADLLRDKGFVIPEADHTAEGDVRATRAVYMALDGLRDAA